MRMRVWLAIVASIFMLACNSKNEDKNKTANREHKIIREVVETYPNGSPKVEHYIDKVTHEYKEVIYYPSGKKFMEGSFTPNHKRTGEWISYFEDGSIKSKTSFKDGKTDGKIEVYHENGSLFYEGYYKQGLKEGIWHVYNDSGKLGAEVKYALDTIVYQKRFFKP
jgi:antitoxin component YwqK of YwqJK toxin-antitoxin module